MTQVRPVNTLRGNRAIECIGAPTLPTRARTHRLAYGIVLLALGLRLAYWRLEWNAPLVIVGDEGNYFSGAVRLARGLAGFWNSDAWLIYHDLWLLPPLYPLSLAGLAKLLGEDVLAWRLFQVLVGVLTIALVYRLARLLFDSRTGVGAALLAAIFFPLLTLPVLVMTENLFIPLVLGAFILLVEFARRGSLLRLFGSGVLLALATLTRAAPTLFFPLVLLWLIGLRWVRSRSLAPRGRVTGRPQGARLRVRWAARLAPMAAFALGAGLVFAPWAARNYAMYGRFLLTDTMGGENFYTDNSRLAAIANPVDRQSFVMTAELANYAAHPSQLLDHIVPNTRHLLRLEATNRLLAEDVDSPAEFARDLLLDDAIFLLTVLLSIVGLIYSNDFRTSSLFAMWTAYNLFLLVVIYFSSVRYRLPMMPLLFPWAVYGFLALKRRLFQSAPAWRNGLAAALCGAAIIFVTWDFPAGFSQFASRELSIANAAGLEQSGQTAAALAALQQAEAADPGSESLALALGDLYRAEGDSARALGAYRSALNSNPDSLAARFRLGDLLRALSQDASAAQIFAGDKAVGPDEMEWAWNHPELLQEKLNRIEVGPLDVGYVRWMFPAETMQSAGGSTTVRWTQPLSQVRVFAPADGTVLNLRLAGIRPDGMARARVTISVDGRQAAQLLAKRGWADYNIALPPGTATNRQLVITLQSDYWSPQDPVSVLPPPKYGVQLEWVQVGDAQVEE